MKLYITEKKEVATAMATALQGSFKDGTYQLENGDKIVWLSGHLLRLADPEELDTQYEKWDLSSLPMSYPIEMRIHDRHSERVPELIEHIKAADELVNVGDPDAEGQRLVDELIEFAGVQKPTYRVLINDNTTNEIIKAVNNIQSNDDFRGLSLSALARSVGDQRYGYNLTRAYTILAQQKGYQGTLSVGRVQTPILGLVVRRDETIEGHKESFYYSVTAELKLSENPVNNRAELSLTSSYQVKDNDPVDEKNRIIDKDFAEQIANDVKGQSVRVASVETKREKVAPPLPYNLLALQSDAAAKFGYKPKRVLEITQTLRDKYQAITYNRSDCRYLNDERHSEAGELLQALSEKFDIAGNADATIKGKAFNSKKVTAHHAIIPTLSVPKEPMPDDLQNIYDLIVKQYIIQFYPHRELDKTKAIFEVAGHHFTATNSIEVIAGWKAIMTENNDDSKDDSEEQETAINGLSDLLKDDNGTAIDSKCEAKKTQPPKRYTMAALLKDIASAAKYVTYPKIKALLLDKDADKADEAGGIGTPATRDSHIETLFNHGYVAEKGKQIISTDLGRQLINALPDFATTPDMIALWHEQQKKIEQGEADYQTLLDDIDKSIADEIERVQKEGLNIKTDNPKCPNCETGYLQQRKGQKGKFWGCGNYPECKTTFPDDKGKPNLNPASKAPVSSEHKCPQCDSGLVRRPSKKDKKKFWWGCSGYPKCSYTTFDNNGKPNL